MKRIFNVAPGYDCRTTCKHTVKGEHGICSDTWIYAIVDQDARAALQLVVSTPFYPATVVSGKYELFKGNGLYLHFRHPTNVEEVLADPPLDERCEYLETCYGASSYGLLGYKIVRASFDQERGLSDPGSEHANPLQDQHALWAALESKLVELIEVKQAERLSDGDLKWRKCECCNGLGVREVDLPNVFDPMEQDDP